MERRRLTPQEEKLLGKLIDMADTANFPDSWKERIVVQPMKDSGMGSLLLFPYGMCDNNREFGAQVSEYQFTDVDGVQVIASLNVDASGELFELDIWKTDFSPLIQIPENL